jgi:HAD superfamily hydrolase (TIGR01509 family)
VKDKRGRVTAVVFDFDGVCIDTEHARFVSWETIYEMHGERLPREEWIKNIGHASWVSDPFEILEKRLGRKLDSAYINTLHYKAERKIADNLPLQPGLKKRLDEAKRSGIKCGIASSSSHRWVDGHLQRRGLLEYFDTIVCREDTVRHKPDPEPFRKALEKIGVKGDGTVAVEDSPTGITSAKAAGFYCIAVPCSITKGMDFSEAHLVVESLEDISFEELILP